MAVEKGLYQAPEGLSEASVSELEVEIVNPESVTLDDGSMEITLVPEPEGKTTGNFDENIAENKLSEQNCDIDGTSCFPTRVY